MINYNIDDYYTPNLVRSYFDNNFEEYEIRGDKEQNLSLKQYITTIKPQLIDLINEKKNSTKNEQKVQLILLQSLDTLWIQQRSMLFMLEVIT